MKIFITSDIHSFLNPLLESLNKEGFDINNKDHSLVILGDLFDRGPDPIGIYNFLKSIPEDRLYLIKGNHELLFETLANSKLPDDYDIYNGTFGTFCKIAGVNEKQIKDAYFDRHISEDFYKDFLDKWNDIKEKVKASEIYKFITSDRWLKYIEIGDYICTHGYIPLINNQYFPEWRTNSNEKMWDDAMWNEGFRYVLTGKFDEEAKKGKKIILGHVPVQNIRSLVTKDVNSEDSSIYVTDKLICLDACTKISGKLNVLVLDSL